MVFFHTMNSPLGKLYLVADDASLTMLSFSAPNFKKIDQCQAESPVLRFAKRELVAYFKGELHRFETPVHPAGTAFQKQVWNALLKIPYGEIQSYGELAKEIGKPGAARAVGGANNKNPIAIMIPCHRVIGQNGSLMGYAGGLKKKEFLLELERCNRIFRQ